MGRSYAVVWREDRSDCAGALSFDVDRLRLDGTRRTGHPVLRELPYSEIGRICVGRSAQDRIGGLPTVIVETAAGGRVAIASAAGVGQGPEIADRLQRLVRNTAPG